MLEDIVMPRQVGHTTAICKAAKEIGAVVVVDSSAEAERVKREFGVEALSYDCLDRLVGSRKPILFDSSAVAHSIRSARKGLETRIQELEADKKCWMDNARTWDKARIKEMEKRDAAVAKAEKLQSEIVKLKERLKE